MTFRQNEIFVKQLGFCSLLMTVVAMLLAAFGQVYISLLCAAPAFLVYLHLRRTEPMVTLDERGVRCFTTKKVLWDLSWAEVAEVRRVSYMRCASVQLVPVRELKQNLHKPTAHPFLGFQLSRTAKKALTIYCPGMRK